MSDFSYAQEEFQRDRDATPHRKTVALVVPLYNEAGVVGPLIEALEDFRSTRPHIVEVVLVDDGSIDETVNELRHTVDSLLGYRVLQFSRNFGHQLAITAGLSVVSADSAVVLDADLQDPLSVVDEMVTLWRDGYDVVYGIRRSRAGESKFKSGLRHGWYVFFQRFTGLDAPLDVGDFRLLSRRVLKAFGQFREQQPYVRGLITWLGYNQVGIEYDRPARGTGRSKYPYRKLVRLAGHGLTSFTNKPLKYAVRIGIAMSILSIIGLVWAVVAKIMQPDLVSGWASIIFVAFLFGGLNLFFLGVVGSYLGRVYEEVKARPRYIVSEDWTSAPPITAGDRKEPELGRSV